MNQITPFTIEVSSRSLEDLAWRLQRARWPQHVLVAGGEDATRLQEVRRLLERWQAAFDWRAHERRLNALAQYRVTVDGIGLHVVWVRSGRPDAEPLLLLNGWPSSFIEYERVIGPLTTPSSGRAFDVVIPARPGYGFSDPALDHPGSDDAVADLFAHLMSDRLGYGRFLVHGDDFGGSIASRLAWRHPALVQALHVTEWLDPTRPGDTTVEEARYLDALAGWRLAERAYGQVAATRPQTLGLALDDSPLGLLAWIVDKFLSWTEPREDGEPAFEDDLLLATTTLYWVTRSMATSMRPYAEDAAELPPGERIGVPAAVVAPREARPAPPRSWIERSYADLRSYRVRERGGHFLAAESPDAFVDELRAFFDGVATTS
jgi:pimeloyl-ACP methyl ester carboxylesterase